MRRHFREGGITILRKTLQTIAPAALAVPGATALAQDEETKVGYVYALYYECDGSLTLVDELVDKYHAPLLDAAVKDGTFSSWGWLAHHTGGTWERVAYVVGTSLDGVLDALDTFGERVNKEIPIANREFFQNCHRHEDYVWRTVAGGDATPGTERGTAGLSVYWKCDATREARDAMIGELRSKQVDAMQEFGGICGTHVDYLWDIQKSTP